MPSKELEFTQYESPDGQTFRFDDRMDRFLLSETGYGMPPIEYLSQRGPFQHGDTIYDYRLARRVIQLVERSNACSRNEYYSHRAEILDMLRPNRQSSGNFEMGTLKKQFPDGSARAIKVMIEEGPIFAARDTSRWDEWAFTEAIRFVAPDPVFYDPGLRSEGLGLEYFDHLIFPFSFQFPDLIFVAGWGIGTKHLVYNGNWPSFPKIIIGGPYDNLLIRNITTGEKLDFPRSISEGETITFSMDYGNKSVTNNRGENLMGIITPDSDLATFHIAPDPEADCGINIITIEGAVVGTGVSTATIEFYDRYIGW